MRDEIAARPASGDRVVLAGGGRAQAQGDLQGAWDAAQAGLGARAARRPTAALRSAPISIDWS